MERDVHLSMSTSVNVNPVYPLWMRCTHWFNALVVIILVLSGWHIYSAVPSLPFTIPASVTLDGRLGGALQWHLTAMWLLMISGLVHLVMNAASSRLAHKFFPVAPAGVRCDMVAVPKGRFSHTNPRHYNNMQRLVYLLVILDIVLLVLSSLVLRKSMQFATL